MHTLALLPALLASALLPGESSARPAVPHGIGVLGDSYSDEYQAYPPDRSAAHNWVEILAGRGLNFGDYSQGSRGEPRNQGFAFNWARSDAATIDAIQTGQHLGLKQQIAAGEIDVVVLFIGGNDFIHALSAADPGPAIRDALPRALDCFDTALTTILDASPHVRVLVGTVPDLAQLPEFSSSAPALLDQARRALHVFNTRVRTLAREHPRVGLVDFDTVIRVTTWAAPRWVPIGGQKIDRTSCGNEGRHAFLADRRHIGTVFQGRMARLIVDSLNAEFGYQISPPADHEILALAGLSPKPEANRTLAADMTPAPAPHDPAITQVSTNQSP